MTERRVATAPDRVRAERGELARSRRACAGLAALALSGVLLWLARAPAEVAASDEPVTWSRHVARVFQQQCQECHRPGDIAPFSLLTYKEAYRWRADILEATAKRLMPPWKAADGAGDFVGVRRLSAAELDLIARWVRAGAPEGDRRELPPPRDFPEGWLLGKPDAVLTPAAAFSVAPSRDDVYRCFVIPTDFPEDRFVIGAEVRPGNRSIVHHVLTFIDAEGRSEALERADPDPGYPCFGGPGFQPRGGLGGWAPGARPQVLPDGVGFLLPRGARVVIQVHYHNRGRATVSDRTAIGVHFARRTIDKRVRVIPVRNRDFVIPAGAARHEVTASFTLPPTWNLHAIAVSPHMHLLGREMKVTATYPDGAVRPLIHIDDWDFHWQGTYTFARPVPLPGGTRIDVRAVFDNSAENARNPNHPPKDVAWGEATTDEMCIAFLRVTVDSERIAHEPPP